MPDFCLYSTDIAATTDPAGASPAPAILVPFARDPLLGDGEFDESAGDTGRGSRFKTLGGVVCQDFGVQAGDGRIFIADKKVLVDGSFIADMRAIHAAVDAEYFFTDGLRVWKVRFARPAGFKAWRHLLFKVRENANVYSYEINLDVISREI